MRGRKFALLLCCEDSDYIKRIYGGYYGVFMRMLKEEGETWVSYNVRKREFPADVQIGEYDGFVITGSCSDAHGDDPWILELLILLNKLDAMKKKILGICFGHQILGRALGGKTGRAGAGWDIGIAKLHLHPSHVFASLEMPDSLSVIECHRDEVMELPPGAEILAWSSKIGIEMFRYQDHILGIQGHPEYNKDILLHLIDRLSNRDSIEKALADEAKAKIDATEPDREAWQKLCTTFLKGTLSYGNGSSTSC